MTSYYDPREIREEWNEQRWPEGIDVESAPPSGLNTGERGQVKPGGGLIAHYVGLTGTVLDVRPGFEAVTVDFGCGHDSHRVGVDDLVRVAS